MVTFFLSVVQQLLLYIGVAGIRLLLALEPLGNCLYRLL